MKKKPVILPISLIVGKPSAHRGRLDYKIEKVIPSKDSEGLTLAEIKRKAKVTHSPAIGFVNRNAERLTVEGEGREKRYRWKENGRTT